MADEHSKEAKMGTREWKGETPGEPLPDWNVEKWSESIDEARTWRAWLGVRVPG